MYGPHSIVGSPGASRKQRHLNIATRFVRRYPSIPAGFVPEQILGYFNAFTLFPYVGLKGRWDMNSPTRTTFWFPHDAFHHYFLTDFEEKPEKDLSHPAHGWYSDRKPAPPSIKYPGHIVTEPPADFGDPSKPKPPALVLPPGFVWHFGDKTPPITAARVMLRSGLTTDRAHPVELYSWVWSWPNSTNPKDVLAYRVGS